MPNEPEWLNFAQFYQKIMDDTVPPHTKVDVRRKGNEAVDEEIYISQEIHGPNDYGRQGFYFNFTSDDADGMVNYYDNLEGPEEVEFRLKPRPSGGKRKRNTYRKKNRRKRKTRRKRKKRRKTKR